MNTIEDILKDDIELKRVKQLEKDISTIESKKSRLTDLLIDGKIEQTTERIRKGKKVS